MNTTVNIDPAEIDKFSALAPRWWDPAGECKPLHDINPLRLRFIARYAPLKGKNVLDVGCGGGILSESLAAAGAQVTAIDASNAAISVAKLHLQESGQDVSYHCTAIEEFTSRTTEKYDVITCMEMLEHVPDPSSIIASCSDLLKPNGHLFLSTLNRNMKSFLLAIVGAEYIMKMIPKGTHDYSQFIQPAEIESWLRQADLSLNKIKGISYNPLFKKYSLSNNIQINYLVHATPT
ncbi:MAG: bifunctional 2-polyprenyl-6-hydroxyphenol methylase/3-demethylubiquinol 3-O-methyltransferase UbiG [Gammaproteobacteria bacterium]|nr:bifunctional 2-polyprenyl-6-hydroxyphenol methylase/3-demethylubiquinol 3-O-methyltransferase UbiG [Gammaproteobacteria bacterium]